jgi:uncharacterized protein with PQ loop repeat
MTDFTGGDYEWLAWLPFTIAYLAGLPQILLNKHNNSTEGLSYRMVFFDYTGALTTTIYAFLLVLPFACRVMEPLCMLNISLLVAQCFYYCKDKDARRFLIASYVGLHTVAGLMLIVAWWHPVQIGMAMGWISVIVQFFTQLPQVLKNNARRSVAGLSFVYISLLGLAGLLEMMISYILALPIQNFFNGLRAVGYYIVLCWQFGRYKKK